MTPPDTTPFGTVVAPDPVEAAAAELQRPTALEEVEAMLKSLNTAVSITEHRLADNGLNDAGILCVGRELRELLRERLVVMLCADAIRRERG